MDHRAAFQCAHCPRNNDPERGRSCPAWWEWTQENPATGETRIERMCGWTAMPIFLVEVIKASNRPAAEIGACKSEIASGLGRIAETMQARLTQLAARDLPQLPPGGAH